MKCFLKKPNNYLNLKNANITDESLGIFVSNEDDRGSSYTMGDIFNQTCNCWVWYYNSSNERFNHYVYFKSDLGYSNHIVTEFYTVSKAEKKLFGIWVVRSKYQPIQKLSGKNSFRIKSITALGTLYSVWNPYFLSGVQNNKGWSEYYGNSNHEFEFINPHGSSVPTYTNSECILSGSYSFRGSFYGGPSGYNSHYHN